MDINARLEFQRLRQMAELSLEEAATLTFVSERQARRYEDITEAGCDPSPLVLEALRRAARWGEPVQASIAEPNADYGARFRFIDLFAGIGGLRRPFEEIGGKCVFTSEWDKFSRQTYAANYHDDPFEHEFAGDIRPYAADPSRVPSHDVLLAGFPCQPFSIAGLRCKSSARTF